MITKSIVLVVTCTLLTGCLKPLQKNVSYESDFDLCYRVKTKPSFNINYENSQKEIRKRGLSCNKFAAEIRTEQRLERLESRIEEANARAAQAERDISRAESNRVSCNIQRNSRFYKRTGYTPPGC